MQVNRNIAAGWGSKKNPATESESELELELELELEPDLAELQQQQHSNEVANVGTFNLSAIQKAPRRQHNLYIGSRGACASPTQHEDEAKCILLALPSKHTKHTEQHKSKPKITPTNELSLSAQ